jgi:hypothetical protein
MAYAIFYNSADLNVIAANVQATLAANYDQFLTTQERNSTKQAFQRAWNGGLSGWATAPIAPVERRDSDADTRIIVVSGQQVSKADMVAALQVIAAKVPGATYMGSIARDLQVISVEPW